jgi:hypothetical protein
MKKNMIRLLVLTAAIVGFSSSLQADVLIYNLTLTNRVMGGGSNTMVVARGKLLRDIDTGENAVLFRYTLSGGRNFFELHCGNFEAKQVIVPGGTNTVLVGVRGVQSPTDPNATVGLRLFYARGTDEPVELRRFRTELAARVLRGLTREVVDGDDGNTFVVESAVTATLNSTLTRDGNTRGTSIPLLLLEQQQAWEDAGFVLAVDECTTSVP